MESLFSFRGTITRSQFWLGIIAGSVIAILLALPLGLIPEPMNTLYFLVILVPSLIGLSWVSFALYAKRLRDAGLRAWLCLLLFVPFVGILVFLIAGLKPTETIETTKTTQLNQDSPLWQFLNKDVDGKSV